MHDVSPIYLIRKIEHSVAPVLCGTVSQFSNLSSRFGDGSALSWSESVRRRGSGARDADGDLGESEPNSQWYVRAAKMRADWRVHLVQQGQPKSLAHDAMGIIDDAIALHQDLDIYGMRMAASFLAEDYDATVETARRMIWAMRSD